MAKLIPATTSPLAKLVRTGEGILLFVFNLAMVIIPIISSSLSATNAAKYAMILNGVALVSRSGLKAIAALGTAGLTPLEPAVLQTSAADIGQLATKIVSQLPADLQGKVTPAQIIDQVAGDIPIADAIPTDEAEQASSPYTLADPSYTNRQPQSSFPGASDPAAPAPEPAPAEPAAETQS